MSKRKSKKDLSLTPNISKTEFLNALENTSGIIPIIAKKLNVSSVAVYKFLRDNRDMHEHVVIERECIIDQAEEGLWEKVKSGHWPAIKFVLTTLGHQRGYTPDGNNLLDAQDNSKQQKKLASIVEELKREAEKNKHNGEDNVFEAQFTEQ